MPYITVDAPIRYHQVTIDEILNALPGATPKAPVGRYGDTRTIYQKSIPDKYDNRELFSNCEVALHCFIQDHADLYKANRHDLYHSFSIPKKTHGYRKIDAPLPPLMSALTELKRILEVQFRASYHTAAFAYAPHRCVIDAVKKHQSNKSRWLLKIDFSNFFGSTTKEFTMRMLKMIWPFSEVMSNERGFNLVSEALDLAFLDGVLPQGTPVSPLLTNLIMIPIDHYLFKTLRDFDGKKFVYTRYADDIDISCRYDFEPKKVIAHIRDVISKFDAPYIIKDEKTHYGSNAGRNWILGVMYNKDFKITIGHKKKEMMRSYLYSYIKSKKAGEDWTLHEVQELHGRLAYLKKVEPEYFDGMIKHYDSKFGLNIMKTIRDDLKNL